MLTLWDLIVPLIGRRKARPAERNPRPEGPRAAGGRTLPTVADPERPAPLVPVSMQDRYDAVARLMLDRYQVRVRKWRTSMSGVAWSVIYRDGTTNRLIEAPRPRGPMSAAVFLHEIGHHAIGLGVFKPRCLEEYHAWKWSLEQMEAHGLNITDAVRHRMHESLWYALAKARRRGIRSVPPELQAFAHRPPTRKQRLTQSR